MGGRMRRVEEESAEKDEDMGEETLRKGAAAWANIRALERKN